MSQHISTYHVHITIDTSDNLRYTVMPFGSLLAELVASGQVIHWWFLYVSQKSGIYEIHIYYPASATIPVGENMEEINRRAITAVEEQGKG